MADSETRNPNTGELVGKTVTGSSASTYSDPSKSRINKGGITARQKTGMPKQEPGESPAAYAARLRKWREAQAGAIEK